MYKSFTRNILGLLAALIGRRRTPPYKLFAKHAYERWHAKEYNL